jgi:hypothetical protein
MTNSTRPARSRHFAAVLAPALCLAAVLASCGGGSPLDNPAPVSNAPLGTSGQKLSYVYYQKCINPIFLARLSGSAQAGNTCAGAGCHDNATGTGGAFRVIPSAQAVDVSNPANTPDAIRASDMYKNFYSAQGETVIGSPSESRLLNKPLLNGVLHGGGQVIASSQDPSAQLIQYWISHPVPQGQDEFSTAANSLFTPADANTGACNTQ